MTATTRPRRKHPVVALRLDGAAVRALDQTVLPFEERELVLSSAADVAEAIKRLSIRGAPLIGVAAGYGLALSAAFLLVGSSRRRRLIAPSSL